MQQTLEDVLEGAKDLDAAGQDALWERLVPMLAGRPFEEHWQAYQRVFASRSEQDGPPVAWRPGQDVLDHAHLTRLMDDVGVGSLRDLHAWSAREREDFWRRALMEFGVLAPDDDAPVLTGDALDPVWCPGRTWNATDACFRQDPDRTALLLGREGSTDLERVSYGRLLRFVEQVGNGLRAAGLGPGDAVALYMPMTLECVVAYLAIVRQGMVVVSVPDSFAAPEVATRLRLGGAKALVTVASFRRGGKDVPMYPRAREAADVLSEDRPVRVVVIGDDVDLAEGDLAWADLLGDEAPRDPVQVAPDTPSNILFSSGTTGEPKAIPWTHLTPFKAAMDGRYHQDIHEDDVVAWPTNIGWMMGPWLIYAGLCNGATIALYEGAPDRGFLDFAKAARVSMLGVVPAMVRAWRTKDMAAPGDLPDVRVFSSTGEASNPQDHLFLMSLAGHRAPVIEYCGGTEIGGGHLTGSVVQPASPATFTTPALGLDVVVLDDAGRPVPPGGHGELFVVPPSIGLSQRLLNRDHHEEYHAGCPRGPNGEALRRHGDEVQVLHGGWWSAQGRADDTMNLGGIKVGSVELERVMNGHPDVHESAAVAVRPEGGGADMLVVFAVPAHANGPAPDDLKGQLQGLLKQELNPLFRIHDVVLVDALPRTASNKVMRRRLRAGYA